MGGFTQGQLRLSLLGKPEISCDGQLLTQESLSLKGEALLIYLAVTGESVSRSLLATLLWGDMAEERAKANLRLALTKLRPFVAAHLIIDRQEVAWDFHQPYWLDVEEFEVNLAESQLAQPSRAMGRRFERLWRSITAHFYTTFMCRRRRNLKSGCAWSKSGCGNWRSTRSPTWRKRLVTTAISKRVFAFLANC